MLLSHPVRTVDYHTCGEPFRIVPDAPIDFAGTTVADRWHRATSDPQANFLRRLLALEPRGHRDMFGGFVVPPDDARAHLGVLFWAQDGFNTGCGHGTMALGSWAVQSGLVPAGESGVTDVHVDVPSGRVTARVHTHDNRVTHVDFVNVASFVIEREMTIATTRGAIQVDVAFGGAMYAHVDARAVGLRVTPENTAQLIAFGQEVRHLVNNKGVAVHPADARINKLCGVIIFDRLGDNGDGDLLHRNILVYGDGQVDRSPCGTGTSSRLAVLAETGELADGQRLIHQSIIGSAFTGTIRNKISLHDRQAVLPIVSGSAHRIGTSVFEVDPFDDLVPGFSFG